MDLNDVEVGRSAGRTRSYYMCVYTYDKFTRVAETRLAQNSSNYLHTS